jgi:hypothetical protein
LALHALMTPCCAGVSPDAGVSLSQLSLPMYQLTIGAPLALVSLAPPHAASGVIIRAASSSPVLRRM